MRASVIDFDVEQDGACCAVYGEVVEQITKIDVETVADGDDGGKPDVSNRGPLHQTSRNGARLRYKREIAGVRHGGRKAGIQLRLRRKNTKAIGPNKPHPSRARRPLALVGI